ncbi:hypothetical protein B0H16DRAFT_1712941 [Mycena metata]|uniref:Yeast cell wall synthesis Kre9/Knh1-like N-terminal domain-containing protein n=1 Tax=Mycena metata TaxID=1033252 RepID=A0AAD7NTK2_9AGAR|nr:hypothetical protein B0H16DRAFT_1712941 [Mycena metata]
MVAPSLTHWRQVAIRPSFFLLPRSMRLPLLVILSGFLVDSALGLAIVNPLGPFSPNADATISWTHDEDDPTINSFNIILQNTAVTLSVQIAASVDISGDTITVHLPGNLPARTDYTFVFVTTAPSLVFATSDPFAIEDGEQTTTQVASTTSTAFGNTAKATSSTNNPSPSVPPSSLPTSSSAHSLLSTSSSFASSGSTTILPTSTPLPIASGLPTAKTRLPPGAIAAIALSLVFLFVLSFLLWLYLCRRTRLKRRRTRLPLGYLSTADQHERQHQHERRQMQAVSSKSPILTQLTSPLTPNAQPSTKFQTSTQQTQTQLTSPTLLSPNVEQNYARRKSLEARLHGMQQALTVTIPLGASSSESRDPPESDLELQNAGLRARIMALEQELHTYLEPERSEEERAPPGYLE